MTAVPAEPVKLGKRQKNAVAIKLHTHTRISILDVYHMERHILSRVHPRSVRRYEEIISKIRIKQGDGIDDLRVGVSQSLTS